MKSRPERPPIEAAPVALLDSGHLWILEAVVGAPLRFRLQKSGILEFGDGDHVYTDPDELPAQYHHAVRHIQRNLDRDALRAAVDDPSEIVFFGAAMQYQGIAYEWDRTPSFLGREIWSASHERFRPPDAVDGIFERLGLQSINPLEQELPARDFNPERYCIPQSAWYDGPAAGIVLRDKQGHRAKRSNPAVEIDESPPPETTAAELAATYGAESRLERLATDLAEDNHPVTAERLFERAHESARREVDPRQIGPAGSVDSKAFRSELAALTGNYVQNNTVQSGCDG